MSDVRSKYHISLNAVGFQLRGAPNNPQYIREAAPSLVNQLGIGDLNYNSLNGSGWSYWTQTDWSGGFGTQTFKDDGSFKDGESVDLLNPIGKMSLQNGWTSAAKISGAGGVNYPHPSHLESYAVHGSNLLLGLRQLKSSNGVTIDYGGATHARVYKMTSAHTLSVLSAMNGITNINSMSRFKNDTLIAMSRLSGTLKTLAKYNGSTLSAFRSTNPIVRAVKGIGIRAYISEYVSSLSGDVLSYSTAIPTFTSAYQAGKGKEISLIEEFFGSPYFFVKDINKVEFYKWDETNGLAILIYTFENLTNFCSRVFLSSIIITGKSNNKYVAYSFDGTKIEQIFSSENTIDTTRFDFSRSFEFGNNFHLKGAQFDGEKWFPGEKGYYNSNYVTNAHWIPFVNFSNRMYGFFDSETEDGNEDNHDEFRIAYKDSTKYAISGNLVSSEFGSNVGAVDKLVNSVNINMDALATGQTVEIFKSLDGGVTFSSIGKASYAQDGAVKKKTLFFPSGFVTKLWNYKAVIVGPGTSTPSVSDITFQYRVVPDLKRRWSLSVDAGDQIKLLNNQDEIRDGKTIIQDVWQQMESKEIVEYQDIDSFKVNLTSAMGINDTSAAVRNTRLMPQRGRIRVNISGVVEEMSYTSADGGRIRGITRGIKNTVKRAYTSGTQLDNFYNVIVTDVREQINNTDQNKTESIAQITILEV